MYCSLLILQFPTSWFFNQICHPLSKSLTMFKHRFHWSPFEPWFISRLPKKEKPVPARISPNTLSCFCSLRENGAVVWKLLQLKSILKPSCSQLSVTAILVKIVSFTTWLERQSNICGKRDREILFYMLAESCHIGLGLPVTDDLSGLVVL